MGYRKSKRVIPLISLLVLISLLACGLSLSCTRQSNNGIVDPSHLDTPIVSMDGWEWQRLLPQGNSLSGIWGTSSTDVFAVGDSGTILHYDGAAWSPMNSGTARGLDSVWGSSPSDVFAVGWSGTILHCDGAAWSLMSSGIAERLYGVWGSSSSDIFAVGRWGTILHCDGAAWSLMSSGIAERLYGVWGSSSSNVFAVGSDGTIMHFSK